MWQVNLLVWLYCLLASWWSHQYVAQVRKDIFWRLHNRASAWEWTADRGGNGPERCFLQFCPSAQEDSHTRVDTGACRTARTSKPVNCKITVRLQHHTNYKTPYDEKQSVFKESKYDIAGRTRKPKTTLWKKRNVYSRQLQSSAMPTTRGQRYTETNDCQTPIKKKKQNWQIE